MDGAVGRSKPRPTLILLLVRFASQGEGDYDVAGHPNGCARRTGGVARDVEVPPLRAKARGG